MEKLDTLLESYCDLGNSEEHKKNAQFAKDFMEVIDEDEEIDENKFEGAEHAANLYENTVNGKVLAEGLDGGRLRKIQEIRDKMSKMAEMGERLSKGDKNYVHEFNKLDDGLDNIQAMLDSDIGMSETNMEPEVEPSFESNQQAEGASSEAPGIYKRMIQSIKLLKDADDKMMHGKNQAELEVALKMLIVLAKKVK